MASLQTHLGWFRVIFMMNRMQEFVTDMPNNLCNIENTLIVGCQDQPFNILILFDKLMGIRYVLMAVILFRAHKNSNFTTCDIFVV